MRIEVDRSGSAQAFQDMLTAMENSPEVKGLIVYTCDANGFTPAQLDPMLTKISIPVMGGIFPAIFHDSDKIDVGTVVVGLPYSFQPHIIRGLSDFDANYVDMVSQTFEPFDIPPTLLLFVDAFSKRVAAFVQSLFEVLGLGLNYVGGGAGSLDLIQKPCVLCNDGMLVDAAVMGAIGVASSIGVKHGWTPICGPFKVTESEQNVLKTLDWEPVLDVYLKAINEHSSYAITIDNLSSSFKAYPFGMASLFAEPVVRDPAMVDENKNFVCVGEIPEGSFVEILHGEPEDLIKAAKQASTNSLKKLNSDPSLCIFIDCVSRFLFLKDKFQLELAAVHYEKVPLVGALSLGEIANVGEEYLSFHNKTAVVALLESL